MRYFIKYFLFRAKIETSCVKGVTECGRLKYCWTIGVGLDTMRNVCRVRFELVYDLGKTYVFLLGKEIKAGIVNSETNMSDRTGVGAISTRKLVMDEVKSLSLREGLHMSREQLSALVLPNTPASLECFAWMKSHFTIIGDNAPNKSDEIHLEPMLIKDVYKEYKDSMTEKGIEHLQPTAFGNMWLTSFSHVKIREYKAVTGKCDTCAKLSELRKTLRDSRSRQHVTQYHYLHRTAYMGERAAYAERADDAVKMPSRHLSLISDGMAQSHCILPWLGNLSTFGNGFSQHIQGVLLHGRGLVCYRTFHNLKNTASSQIHAFLMTLEKIYVAEGRLPDTVYYQIDGGSENTAKCVLGVCELLIARGLTKQIVLTRLMVGHTHADIDAVFGRLWKAVRNAHVNTPQEYERMIVKSLSVHDNYDAEVCDFFTIPDYKAMLDPAMDHKFGCYCKEDQTQLQFIFEAVTPSEDFPLGCKTTYRAFSRPQVMEIVSHAGGEMGMLARNVNVNTFPEATSDHIAGKL
jgi:hypothetical protein